MTSGVHPGSHTFSSSPLITVVEDHNALPDSHIGVLDTLV